MILLKILSGTKAGAEQAARRFPVRVGRHADAHLRLSDSGVWEDHFRIEFERGKGFSLTPRSEARTLVNDVVAQTRQLLRNGDIITVGSAKLQFWLGPVHQKSQRVQEFFIWLMIGGVSVGQVALVYWLLRITG